MSPPRHYILEGHSAVPVEDLLEWARWFETNERRVRLTRVGPYEVSTVFLGLDHRFGNGPPLLFETMVFLPEMVHEIPGFQTQFRESLDICARCSTWAQAEAQHARIVAEVRQEHDEIEQLYPLPTGSPSEPLSHIKE